MPLHGMFRATRVSGPANTDVQRSSRTNLIFHSKVTGLVDEVKIVTVVNMDFSLTCVKLV